MENFGEVENKGKSKKIFGEVTKFMKYLFYFIAKKNVKQISSGRATTMRGRYVGSVHFDFSSTLVWH